MTETGKGAIMNTSKDEILRAIATHQEKIARLRKWLNRLEVEGYDWEKETPDQKANVLFLMQDYETGEMG